MNELLTVNKRVYNLVVLLLRLFLLGFASGISLSVRFVLYRVVDRAGHVDSLSIRALRTY